MVSQSTISNPLLQWAKGHLLIGKFVSGLQFLILFMVFASSALALKAAGDDLPFGIDGVSGLKPGTMLIIPRMVEANRMSLTEKSKGLLVYQVDSKSGYWYYDGAAWSQIAGEVLTVVKAGSAAGVPWILRTQAGKDISVQAPESKLGAVTEFAGGYFCAFTSQISIAPGRESMFISRTKNMYPQLTSLEFQGQKVQATILKGAADADVQSFFNLLGCNVIQPNN